MIKTRVCPDAAIQNYEISGRVDLVRNIDEDFFNSLEVDAGAIADDVLECFEADEQALLNASRSISLRKPCCHHRTQ